MKIKKGDIVLVISGKWKGKTGRVLRSFPKERKVLVEGVNLVKKHQRARRVREKGKIVEAPKPLSVSKVKLICPHCKKATRVGYLISDEKEKKRLCKKCKKEIP
jgi:large subunit ribosomal protein L24